TITPVTDLINEQYLNSAQAQADRVTAALSTYLPCASSASDDCATQFIQTYGRKLYRAPVGSDDTARLMQLFHDAKAEGDFSTGIGAVLEGMLLSPRFLFVLEAGQAGNAGTAVALTPPEVAARLSLFFWRSAPDDMLIAAADAGQLSDPAAVEQQARRMLADPRSDAMLQDFALQWLRIEPLLNASKDATIYPTFSTALAAEMQTETTSFFRNLVKGNSGDFSTL